MAIRRSTSMDRMWNDWRSTFPESDRASDGWLGDLAHQQGSSGHNPDDTPGVTAERQDTDSEQEVRAIDKDKDLRSPSGVTLEQVIQRMLKTPADLVRLIYIIYRGRIWKKSNGWRQEVYTGSNQHNEHGHFSGDPASDENGAEWKSITSFKEGGTMANEVQAAWHVGEIPAGNRPDQITQGNSGNINDGKVAGQQRDTVLAFSAEWAYKAMVQAEANAETLDQIKVMLTNLLSGGISTDALAEDIASKVIAGMPGNLLTDDDKPIITAAVKDALRQGTE